MSRRNSPLGFGDISNWHQPKLIGRSNTSSIEYGQSTGNYKSVSFCAFKLATT